MAILDNLMGALANPNPLMQFGIGVLGSNTGNYGRTGPALMGGMQAVQQAQLIKAKQEQDKQEAALRQQQMELQQQKLSAEQAQAQQMAQLGPQVGGLLSGIQGLPDSPQKQAVVGMLNAGVPLSSLTNLLPGVLGGPKDPMMTATQADYDRAMRDPQFQSYLFGKLPPITETRINEQGLQERRVVPRMDVGKPAEAAAPWRQVQAQKPLPEGAQASLASASEAERAVDTMMGALDEGLQTGLGTAWVQENLAKYAPLPETDPRKKFYVARNALVNQAQAMIKGTPSNFDVQNFEKTLASFSDDERTNRLKLQWAKDQINNLRQATIQGYEGTGYKIPGQGKKAEVYDDFGKWTKRQPVGKDSFGEYSMEDVEETARIHNIPVAEVLKRLGAQ